DFFLTYELQDFHGRGRSRCDLLKLLFFDHDVFALTGFVAFYNVGTIHGLVLLGAKPYFLNAREILAMKHVEVDMIRSSCRKQPDRKGDQSEAQETLPNSCWHLCPL